MKSDSYQKQEYFGDKVLQKVDIKPKENRSVTPKTTFSNHPTSLNRRYPGPGENQRSRAEPQKEQKPGVRTTSKHLGAESVSAHLLFLLLFLILLLLTFLLSSIFSDKLGEPETPSHTKSAGALSGNIVPKDFRKKRLTPSKANA